MTEPKTEDNSARLSSGRAFLERLLVTLPDSKAQLTFWSLMMVGLALDLWTKKVVFDWLEHRGDVSIVNGFLQLTRALNNGAAFGLLPGKPYLLAVVSVVALIAIFAVFLFSGNRQRLVHIALGLFTAGVCGNLYDRIFNGGFVRDFVDVVYWPGKHWPAFNVADSLLCIGVGLLLISTFFTGRSARRHVQQRK